MPSDATTTPAVGYVLKMYPRFSETFIVSEILAREAAGERVVIFSLRPPVDPRFHPELARVAAPVLYVERPTKPSSLWEVLRATAGTSRRLAERLATHLPELLSADADDAVQAVAVARLVEEHGVGHLHAHFASMATTVARLAALLTERPYSFTAHAKDIFHESVDAADLERKLADAHHAVTVSDFNLAHLSSTFPNATDHLHRVYNGLELDRFPYAPRDPRTGAVRLCAVGRLVEKKGFGLLVDAVDVLRRDGVDVELSIAGGGPLADALRDQVARLGLDDVVTLLGPLPQNDVSALLAASDAFVAPCVVGDDGNADGLPTVILEAMAGGVPCVASDVTGIPEVVRDGETGLLVRTGRLDDLVEALRTVAAPDFDPHPLTTKARRLIEDHFDSALQAATLRRLDATSTGATR